jgi:hypothetical protein
MTLHMNASTALTAVNSKTDPVTIRTGHGNRANQEFNLIITGTWAGTITILRKHRKLRGNDSGEPKWNALVHTGSDGAAALTDANLGATADELIGGWIRNDTDVSMGPITDNTATVVTATLAGGTDNDWDAGDNGSFWEIVDTYTANASVIGTEGADAAEYLAVMSAYTSGTARVVFNQ